MYVDRMRLMRDARGSGRHSFMQGKARRIFNQVTTGTISVDTLRWRLGRGTEHVWVCPECNDVDSGFYSILIDKVIYFPTLR